MLIYHQNCKQPVGILYIAMKLVQTFKDRLEEHVFLASGMSKKCPYRLLSLSVIMDSAGTVSEEVTFFGIYCLLQQP